MRRRRAGEGRRGLARAPGTAAALSAAPAGASAAGLSDPVAANSLLFWSGFAAVLLVGALGWAIGLRRKLEALEAEKAGLLRRSLTDPLTGERNRAHLTQELERLFAEGETRLGLLHVELAEFKTVTRSLGQAAGDEALRAIARMIRDIVRKDDFIARVGGDEFVIVMRGVADARPLERAAREIVEALGRPISFGPHQRRLPALVGVAHRDAGADTPERLLMNADLALHEARRAGRPRHHVFTDAARAEFETRERLLAEMQDGLRDDAFEPFFQPQVDVAEGRLIGFEALARWRHPSRGVLAPGCFLAAAEESGMIDRIGAMVLRKALQALGRWRMAGYGTPTLGLNFSAAELRDPVFLDKLQWDLELVDVEPGQISIEVLESVLIEEEDDPAARNVAALGAAGFRIDLDDFGTGHASISNLGRIAVDRLKIDRSFVAGLDADPTKRKLAGAIIHIAETLGLETIAEGVETEGEMRALLEMGCVRQQGFLHGRPMSADDALEWMAADAARGRAVALAAEAPRRTA